MNSWADAAGAAAGPVLCGGAAPGAAGAATGACGTTGLACDKCSTLVSEPLTSVTSRSLIDLIFQAPIESFMVIRRFFHPPAQEFLLLPHLRIRQKLDVCQGVWGRRRRRGRWRRRSSAGRKKGLVEHCNKPCGVSLGCGRQFRHHCGEIGFLRLWGYPAYVAHRALRVNQSHASTSPTTTLSIHRMRMTYRPIMDAPAALRG